MPSASAALDDAALAEEIERRSHSILGKITVEPGRGAFPLAIETARRFAANRIALVGEAAHAIPPIGAQGLNLGLRDAATIGELVVEARRDGGDLGAADVLARYDAARRADVKSRTLRGRSAQPHAAVGFPAGAGRARPRPLSDRPDRPVAPRRHARGRRAPLRSRG